MRPALMIPPETLAAPIASVLEDVAGSPSTAVARERLMHLARLVP